MSKGYVVLVVTDVDGLIDHDIFYFEKLEDAREFFNNRVLESIRHWTNVGNKVIVDEEDSENVKHAINGFKYKVIRVIDSYRIKTEGYFGDVIAIAEVESED